MFLADLSVRLLCARCSLFVHRMLVLQASAFTCLFARNTALRSRFAASRNSVHGRSVSTKANDIRMSVRTVPSALFTQSDSKLVALVLNYKLPTQLYDAAPSFSPNLSAIEARQLAKPAIVAGDLDSITDDVRHFYAQMNTEIKDLSHDQDTTDLQKCLAELENKFSTQELAENTIVVAGGLGGRLDHVMSALSTLHKWPHLHLMLWGDGSMAQLLTPGKHLITPAKGFEGPTCGLVPLSGPATITTQGLKWDLDHSLSEFTGLISTSNHIVGDTVMVETDANVIWITETAM